ncbi:MAG: Rdx family protein [Dehalococcoidales bacterium]|nr:Rdx family protein [Dehalococcoidales bacterium]
MAKRPVKITITYCAECGYEPQTLEVARAVMVGCQHEVSSLVLIPWFEGSFEVSVDGKLVHSMYQDGGFPEPASIIEAVHAASSTEG